MMNEQIFRCTDGSESSCCPIESSAFLLNDSVDNIPEGFPLYIIPENTPFPPNKELNYVVTPSDLEPGNFIRLRDFNGVQTVQKLLTGDIPDRTLFLTGHCNSNCIMCPYSTVFREQTEGESLELQLKYISLMSPDAEYLCVTGGEPTLLGEDFLAILEAVKKHFYSPLVHILTNGRTFYYLDFIKAYRRVRPYKTLLGIPLYATTAELHDSITRTEGSFDQTTKALDQLHSFGEHLEIRIVVTKLNYLNLPELASMIAGRYPNVRHVCIMGMELMGNARINCSDVWIPFDIVIPSIEKATDLLLDQGIPVRLYNLPYCLLNQKYSPLYQKSITPWKIVYLPECENCHRKEDCGGFFYSTASMKDIKIHPFED